MKKRSPTICLRSIFPQAGGSILLCLTHRVTSGVRLQDLVSLRSWQSVGEQTLTIGIPALPGVESGGPARVRGGGGLSRSTRPVLLCRWGSRVGVDPRIDGSEYEHVDMLWPAFAPRRAAPASIGESGSFVAHLMGSDSRAGWQGCSSDIAGSADRALAHRSYALTWLL